MIGRLRCLSPGSPPTCLHGPGNALSASRAERCFSRHASTPRRCAPRVFTISRLVASVPEVPQHVYTVQAACTAMHRLPAARSDVSRDTLQHHALCAARVHNFAASCLSPGSSSTCLRGSVWATCRADARRNVSRDILRRSAPQFSRVSAVAVSEHPRCQNCPGQFSHDDHLHGNSPWAVAALGSYSENCPKDHIKNSICVLCHHGLNSTIRFNDSLKDFESGNKINF